MGNVPRRKFKPRFAISKPCTESWEAMTGTRNDRHCLVCSKQVHNFAAMTESQIEQAVRENNGNLCASLIHRADGSFVTLQANSQAPIAGRIALAASLAFGATAAAQSGSGATEPARARLTGSVLVANGSGPAIGAVVSLTSDKQAEVSVKTDSNGTFAVSAPPGTFDISIRQNAFFAMKVPRAELHEGDQILPPVRTHFSVIGQEDGQFVTMGAMASVTKYPVSYLFKHPLRYLKHLPHNFS